MFVSEEGKEGGREEGREGGREGEKERVKPVSYVSLIPIPSFRQLLS